MTIRGKLALLGLATAIGTACWVAARSDQQDGAIPIGFFQAASVLERNQAHSARMPQLPRHPLPAAGSIAHPAPPEAHPRESATLTASFEGDESSEVLATFDRLLALVDNKRGAEAEAEAYGRLSMRGDTIGALEFLCLSADSIDDKLHYAERYLLNRDTDQQIEALGQVLDLLRRHGVVDEARTLLEKLDGAYSAEAIQIGLAWLDASEGRLDEAIQRYQAQLTPTASSPGLIHLRLAELRIRDDQPDLARQHADLAVRYDPSLGPILKGMFPDL